MQPTSSHEALHCRVRALTAPLAPLVRTLDVAGEPLALPRRRGEKLWRRRTGSRLSLSRIDTRVPRCCETARGPSSPQNSWQPSRIRSFFILFPWNFVIGCAKMPPILQLASRRSALLASSKHTCNWFRHAHTDGTSCARMHSWSLPQWTRKPPCSNWPVE